MAAKFVKSFHLWQEAEVNVNWENIIPDMQSEGSHLETVACALPVLSVSQRDAG